MAQLTKPPQVGLPRAPQGTEPESIRNLMVNYIPTTIDELQLRQLFEMYGPVESVKIVLDRETRSSRGYGFVKYRFAFSAVHAIQYLNGYPLINKRLKVAYANASESAKVLANPESQGQYQAPFGPGAPGAAAAGGGAEMSHPWMQQQMQYMQQMAAMQQMMQYQQQAAALAQPAGHGHAGGPASSGAQ